MSRESPVSVPGILARAVVNIFFRQIFIIFARNIFHYFENSPGSFSTLWRQNWMKPVRIPLILPNLTWKNSYSQNKFATSEKKPNKNRKVTSRSEIFGVQTSLTAHPYYSISICKISFTSHKNRKVMFRSEIFGVQTSLTAHPYYMQDKLYESFLGSKLAWPRTRITL